MEIKIGQKYLVGRRVDGQGKLENQLHGPGFVDKEWVSNWTDNMNVLIGTVIEVVAAPPYGIQHPSKVWFKIYF